MQPVNQNYMSNEVDDELDGRRNVQRGVVVREQRWTTQGVITRQRYGNYFPFLESSPST